MPWRGVLVSMFIEDSWIGQGKRMGIAMTLRTPLEAFQQFGIMRPISVALLAGWNIAMLMGVAVDTGQFAVGFFTFGHELGRFGVAARAQGIWNLVVISNDQRLVRLVAGHAASVVLIRGMRFGVTSITAGLVAVLLGMAIVAGHFAVGAGMGLNEIRHRGMAAGTFRRQLITADKAGNGSVRLLMTGETFRVGVVMDAGVAIVTGRHPVFPSHTRRKSMEFVMTFPAFQLM